MEPADHPLVAALPEPVRADLVAQLRRVSHSVGTVILAEGTLSTDFFLMFEGTVEIVRGGEVVGTVEAGSFFGELGAQDAGPGYAMARNATVRALTAVELGVLDEAAFTRFLRSVPEFRDAIHATTGRQAQVPAGRIDGTFDRRSAAGPGAAGLCG
jgi:CRP-like cAMP-binding protein